MDSAMVTSLVKLAVVGEGVVAPYEADAQLAYLSRTGYVALCISEDSDLLCFGCPRVLYKMQRDGHGTEMRLASVLAGEPLEQFQAACVLMGCDCPQDSSSWPRDCHALGCESRRRSSYTGAGGHKLRIPGSSRVLAALSRCSAGLQTHDGDGRFWSHSATQQAPARVGGCSASQ